MSQDSIARRHFLKGAGVASAALASSSAQAQGNDAAPAALPQQNAAAPAKSAPDAYLALTATEAAFLTAVYDTFIPADALSPSGADCGLVVYWDRQLAGAYGNGARFYRAGPFMQGKPEQGYQLPLTPREYFAAGIKAANAYAVKTYGREFDRLAPAERDAMLKDMDQGKAQFDGFNSKQFLEALYTSAMEGFFSDPLHGGNRDKASWKMIGYPGLPATYARTAEQYRGKKVNLPPQSIQDFI
jgi:gluconate 2-dehydrogenase gamma chain